MWRVAKGKKTLETPNNNNKNKHNRHKKVKGCNGAERTTGRGDAGSRAGHGFRGAPAYSRDLALERAHTSPIQLKITYTSTFFLSHADTTSHYFKNIDLPLKCGWLDSGRQKREEGSWRVAGERLPGAGQRMGLGSTGPRVPEAPAEGQDAEHSSLQ